MTLREAYICIQKRDTILLSIPLCIVTTSYAYKSSYREWRLQDSLDSGGQDKLKVFQLVVDWRQLALPNKLINDRHAPVACQLTMVPLMQHICML